MSEQQKHTPGPWMWFGDDLHNADALASFLIAFEAARDPKTGDVAMADVAVVSEPVIRTDGDTQDANAHLIAAAPDYDAAAREMITRHDASAKAANFNRCGCDDCKPFRPIIAKAEGRQP